MYSGWFALCLTLCGLQIHAKSLESNPLVQVATATNQFTSDVYQAVISKDSQSNVVVSPASAAIALSMLANGARGRTLNEIISALHLPSDPNFRNAGFRQLIDALQSQNLEEDLGSVFELANFMWVPKGVTVRGDFARLLRDSYSTVVRDADFTRPEAVRALVNRRISDATHSRIPELLPAGSVTPDTQILLANALYFKGRWLTKFDARDTITENFYLENGRILPTPMMKLSSTMKSGYLTDLQAKAALLPYENERFALLVIVPENKGGIQQLESGLESYTMRSILGKLSHRDLTLSLPRFKVDYAVDLADILKQVGVADMFGSSADLSGITGSRSLKISSVVHRGTIEVNEEGSEAAAATGFQIVPLMGVTGPRGPMEIKADRPFMFYLLDRDTNIPLFVGRVKDPSLSASQSSTAFNTNPRLPELAPFAAKKPSDGLGQAYYPAPAVREQDFNLEIQDSLNPASGLQKAAAALSIPLFQPSYQPHSRFPIEGSFQSVPGYFQLAQVAYPDSPAPSRRFRAINEKIESSPSTTVESISLSEADLGLRAQDKHWFKKPLLEEVLIPVDNSKKSQESSNVHSTGSAWRPAPAAMQPASTSGNSFGSASQGPTGARPSFAASIQPSNFPSFAPPSASGFPGFGGNSNQANRPSRPQGPQGAAGEIVFPDGVDSRLGNMKNTSTSGLHPTK